MLGSVRGQLRRELLFLAAVRDLLGGLLSSAALGWRVAPLCPCPSTCSPRSWCRVREGEEGAWSAGSHLRGKGRNCLFGLCGVLGRMESIVRKASLQCCPGVIRVGRSGCKIRGKMVFILLHLVSGSVSFQVENTATQLEEQ